MSTRQTCATAPVTGVRIQLDCFDHFSDTLLDAPAGELWRYLRGPSLFRLPGRRIAPLFVSVLLHGNEDTGWRAIQAVLRRKRPRGAAPPAPVVRRQPRGCEGQRAHVAAPGRLQPGMARHHASGYSDRNAFTGGVRNRAPRKAVR